MPDNNQNIEIAKEDGKYKVVYENMAELSQRTKLPVSWWYQQTRQKGPDAVPHIKAGKYNLFIPDKVDAWLQRNKNR